MTDPVLHLVDDRSAADLGTYLRRAGRADPDGGARMVVHGNVLAVYVCPLVGGGGPTAMGLRTFALTSGTAVDGLDVVVPIAALGDRLARPENGSAVPVPPMSLTGLAWTGIAPPRSGWEPGGTVPGRELLEAADAGISEVAAGSPDAAGAPAVASLRARVWGRSLPGSPAVPAGAAFVAHALGFVVRDEEATLFTNGPWTRLSMIRGHVLARLPLLGR